MIYNKLVRDQIPDIIRASGKEPVIRTLDDGEYFRCLNEKLDEEVAEFHADRTVEELADILEVVFALTEALGVSREELMQIYGKKHSTRGGFQDRLFLVADTDGEI